ncbi:MAG: acyl-CoA synthetase [Cellvibrionales bacterium]|nr:acyl-CoA synthetase [Cellvibrionales bacterium]
MTNKSFNIADMFEMIVDAVPEREALICGDYRTTYKEFDERANQLAHLLVSRGIKAGDHVGLYMYNCGEYLEGMMACFKIRAVPINVNYRYVGEELSYIFTNADMVACIHGREFIPNIKDIQASAPDLKTFISVNDGTSEDLASIGSVDLETELANQPKIREFGERSGDDLFILYTGGTTGYPKGVMWPQENVFFAAMSGGGAFSGNPCEKPEDILDRMAQHPMGGIALAPLMHGASWWYACIMLLAGNKLVLNPNKSLVGEQVWGIVEQEKLNLIQIVGDAMAIPLLESLKENEGRWDLSSVFNIGSGGAVFSEAKQQEFREAFPNCFITNAFGSSESGQMGKDSGSKKDEENGGLGNVERSEFMDVIITEEDGTHRHAKPGEVGDFSRSGHIPRGYYNDPEKTAKTFVPVDGKTWLLTGDQARLEADGQSITVYGRGSNCINSGGEKIFPEEVEQALKAHPEVYDCLVVATPHERWGSQVTAVISTKKGAKPSLESLQEEARKHIAGYKVPRELHIADEIGRLPNGKPDYKWAKEYALSKEGISA